MCHILIAIVKYDKKYIFINISAVKVKESLVLNVQSLVLKVQSLVLNVHLLYVQNQALKAFSDASTCSKITTTAYISAIVDYTLGMLKSIIQIDI